MSRFTIALAAACATSAAGAEPASRAHISLVGGTTYQNLDCTGATRCDKHSRGARASIGYRLDEAFAVEFGVATFGKTTGTDGSFSATLHPTARLFGVRYDVPLDARWAVAVRAGLARVTTRVDGTLDQQRARRTEAVQSPYAGLSLSCTVRPGLQAEAGVEATRWQFGSVQGTLRLISVGVTVAF